MPSDAPVPADLSPVPDAATITGLLADEDRRRVVAALVLGATTMAEVRAATGLAARSAGTALARLVEAELVVRGDDGTHLLLGEAFRLAAMAAAPPRPAPDPTGNAPDDQAKVLRTFLRAGRLVRIPAKHSQRLIVLDHLAQRFEVGERFTERQVNATLRPLHDDVAALRRHLVDEGFLDRAAGRYWRAGGRFPVD